MLHLPSHQIALLALVPLLLAGCAVGPDYQPPAVPVPKAWLSAQPDQQSTPVPAPVTLAAPASQPTIPNAPAPAPAQISAQPATQAMATPTPVPAAAAATDASIPAAQMEQEWWRQFHDPILDQLIAQALQSNFDLQIAQARIEQARAMRAGSFASLLPTGDVKASATREANVLAIAGEPAEFKQPYNLYQTGFDASWELDIFGGNKRALEANAAEEDAAEADRNNVLVSMLAEVARTYIDIRQYQEQIRIAKEIVAIENNSVSISRQRFSVGNAPGIDVAQALAQAEQTEAQLPVYENALKQAEFSLDVLLGQQPGSSLTLVDAPQPLPIANDRLTLDAPAAVIANRPDLRAAERRLQEATANQGVALAKFFPDISLSGFVGLLSTNVDTLFHAASKSWSMGASTIWPIFNYGQLSANLDYADAKQTEAMADYQKAVISALSDVERAVTAYNREKDHQAVLARVEKENERASRIAHERYREGMTSFLEVLVTDQSLFNARSQLEQASAATLQDLVAIYKSLGRGWDLPASVAAK